MTHYDIDYSAILKQKGEAAADAKALDDIRDYLGVEKFDSLTVQFRALGASTLTVEQLGFYLMLPGISGYPVGAWHRHIFPALEPDASAAKADGNSNPFDGLLIDQPPYRGRWIDG